MKQFYYVNGKKVDFNTYANALNAEITAEETRKEYEVKIKGFIDYINKKPSVLEKWNNTSFSPESIIKILFDDWCKSDDCKALLRKYECQKKTKAWGCFTLIVICIVLFILRISGVI